MALLDRGDELAVDDLSQRFRGSGARDLASLAQGRRHQNQSENQGNGDPGRIGVRLKIRRLIFAPFLGIDRESGSVLMHGSNVCRRVIR